MKTPARIALFASGNGSNAEVVINYFKNRDSLKVVLLLSNNPQALALEKASRLGIEAKCFSKDEFREPENIIATLHQRKITHIVLAGFLLQIPAQLIKVFPSAILNIHPSLLPKFGGKGMYGLKVHEAVRQAGETETGITIHEVNEQYDEGRIVFQATCPVLTTDLPADIAQKVQRLEHENFPIVIEQWITGYSNQALTQHSH